MGYREARIRAKKRATDVARMFGIKRISVYQWEEGISHPTADKLLPLAEFYGCTVEELLRGNPIKKRVQKTGQEGGKA